MDIAKLFTGLITIIPSFGYDAYPSPSFSHHTFIYEKGNLKISGRAGGLCNLERISCAL